MATFDPNKALSHYKELWDKLDPRDRDLLMKKSDLDNVDTLKDWKALTDDEKCLIVMWLND